MKYDFTIFGTGISAKITSCLLARHGFEVCLISDNQQDKEILTNNLVTFLSAGSLNYLLSIFPNLKSINDHPEIQEINCELNGLNSEKKQSIRFKNEGGKYLGKIIKNIDLEKNLDEEINALSNINFINAIQLSKIEDTVHGVKLKFNNSDDIETELFILSSTKGNISDQIQIDFIKKDLEQEALSISIKGKIKDKNCAFQKFTSDGPIALLPYSKNEASVVWSLKNNSNILGMNTDELTQNINKHLNDYVSSLEITSVEKHKLHFAYAKNLFNKNTVLIGNVAHNIHPIAGQGLNLTIKDIALFIKQVVKYKTLGYKVNDQKLLAEFEMKRKLDNSAYSFGTFALNGILSSNNKLVNFTTRKGLGIVERSKYLKQLLIKSATGRDFFKSL